MKLHFQILILSTFFVISHTTAQNVVEVSKMNLGSHYIEVMEKLEKLRTSPESALNLLNESLQKISNPYERFNLIFWEIPALYCELGKFEEGFKVLKNGQKEGLFYPIFLEPNKFPSYIANFESFSDFKSFLVENERLKTAAQDTTDFEYVVQLPRNYTKEKKYPLLMILHGGFGSHTQLMHDWYSPKLDSGFITVYTQGDRCLGNFLLGYSRDKTEMFVTAWKHILEKYSVDTTHVILGSQSAGAHHSLKLMFDEMLPVKGMILAIPAVPELDMEKVKKAAGRRIRAAILAGENDPRIIKTKEMSVEFDKLGLKNRLIIFPGKGHEFPDEFSKQIDLSLDFILE
ncbi:MAG: hypothetical protein V1720_15625 [bacterium]